MSEQAPDAESPVPLRWTAWLVWRQQRAVLAAIAVLAAAIGTLLILDIAKLGHADALGVRACLTVGRRPGPSCDYPIGLMAQAMVSTRNLKVALLVFPAIIGSFAGAPLIAREHESGTFYYTWTQGLPPRRWLMLTVTLTGTAITLLTAADGILYNISAGLGNLGSGYIISGYTFPAQAPALSAWTLFAYALGVAAGAVVRRTLPAMGVTLCGYGAVYYLTKAYLRPGYQHIAFWAAASPHANHFWAYQVIEAGWLLLASLIIAAGVAYAGAALTAAAWWRSARRKA